MENKEGEGGSRRGRGSHVVVELGSAARAGAELGIRESRKSALGQTARNSSRYLQLGESELNRPPPAFGRGRCFGDGNP